MIQHYKEKKITKKRKGILRNRKKIVKRKMGTKVKVNSSLFKGLLFSPCDMKENVNKKGNGRQSGEINEINGPGK